MTNSVPSRLMVLSEVRASRLGNTRNVWVYLPAGYDETRPKRYPVLYMHVGQHVFEPQKLSGESWGMHRIADRLIAEGLIEPILIVAIEHKHEAGESEYFHDLCAYPIRCTGDKYEHFLIHELKPMIDERFLTLTDAANTALMGSSAAGIATYTIGLRNPDVFGRLGILSPFLMKVDPDTLEETPQYRLYPYNAGQRVWLDIGGAEGFFMANHVKQLADAMLKAGWKQGEELYYLEDKEAAHSEWAWSRRAYMPLLHFFGKPGTPVHVALEGPDTVGVIGPVTVINAVVTVHNGIRFSQLEGSYRTEHPDILEVTPDGRLLAKQPGETTVHFEHEGLMASRLYTVTGELSNTVEIDLEIHVPGNTPEDAEIYATFPVPKLAEGLYGRVVRLPRHLTFDFLITRGYDKEEVDAHYKPLPYRRLVADRDKKVRYTVSHWSDLKP